MVQVRQAGQNQLTLPDHREGQVIGQQVGMLLKARKERGACKPRSRRVGSAGWGQPPVHFVASHAVGVVYELQTVGISSLRDLA